ncbi:hypothetical protein ACFL6U_28140, partial [Planctomycetota bacterium]
MRGLGIGRGLCLLGVCLLLLGAPGCDIDGAKPVELDTSEESRGLILQALRARADQATAFRAYGKSWHGIVNDDGKTETFGFNARLWFRPPLSLRLQSHATMHGNIDLGCNNEEFWLGIKPQISTYYWGRWDRALTEGLLPFNPKVVLEAIGIVEVGEEDSWDLAEDDEMLVLSRADPNTEVTKRVFIDARAQKIKRIIYTDGDGTPLVTAQLSGYRRVSNDFDIPTVIRITALENGEPTGWIKLVVEPIRAGKVDEYIFDR